MPGAAHANISTVRSQIDVILGLEDCYTLAVRLVQERRCIDERALRYLHIQRLGGQASLQGLRHSNALILLLLNIYKKKKYYAF